MSLAARVLDHLADTLLPWRIPPVTALTAPTTPCPDPVEPPPLPPPSGYDAHLDHQPWVARPTLHWTPATGRWAAEIAAAHLEHLRLVAGAPDVPDPDPDRLVQPYIVPGEAP